MKVNQKQLQQVMGLPGAKRFEHFVKVIVDWQEVWGLYQDGWALAGTDDGTTVFPFWPAEAYAHACAQKEWTDYKPRSINLDDFLAVLLPKLKADGVLPGVFYTPSDKGVTPPVDDLIMAITSELRKY